MRIYRSFFISFLLIFTISGSLYGQKFKFSVHGALVLAQVDGDKLRGFSKIGYNAGIQGGYRINASSEFIVAQGFSSFGSKGSNKSIKRPDDYFIEINMVTANLLFAYAHYLNTGWSGESKFRLFTGIKIHQVLSNDYTLSYNSFEENPPVMIEDFRDRFLGIYLGAGYLVASNLYLDLSFEHSLSNILEDSPLNTVAKSLNPYHISIGLNFYL
ncbi:MAG: outer membrane beta-barrel protein [Saprospiraceae bacterium]|nr:outer membrane beta-barrel protein [Saprospiraceae bacterium]